MGTNVTAYRETVVTLIEINISFQLQENINLHYFTIVTLQIRKRTTNRVIDNAVIKYAAKIFINKGKLIRIETLIFVITYKYETVK